LLLELRLLIPGRGCGDYEKCYGHQKASAKAVRGIYRANSIIHKPQSVMLLSAWIMGDVTAIKTGEVKSASVQARSRGFQKEKTFLPKPVMRLPPQGDRLTTG
jgi:hypothetical protein